MLSASTQNLPRCFDLTRSDHYRAALPQIVEQFVQPHLAMARTVLSDVAQPHGQNQAQVALSC